MDKKATKVLRSLFQRCKDAIDENAKALPENYQSLLTPVSEQFSTTLASLNKDKDDDAGDVTTGEVDLVTPVVEYLMASTKQYSAAFADAQKQLAELPVKIEEAIKSKVDAGDLVEKSKVDEKVTLAKQEVETKFKTLASRKESITKASLPLPTDEAFITSASDEDFNKALDSATKRVKTLADKGIALNSDELKTRILWANEADFNSQVSLMEDVLAAAKKSNQDRGGRTAEPLASGASQATAGQRIPYV